MAKIIEQVRVPYSEESTERYQELFAQIMEVYENLDGPSPKTNMPYRISEDYIREVVAEKTERLNEAIAFYGEDSQQAIFQAKGLYTATALAINAWAGFPLEVIAACRKPTVPIPSGVYELVMGMESWARPRSMFECASTGCPRTSPDPRVSRYCVRHRGAEEVMSTEEAIEWSRMAASVELQLSASVAVDLHNELMADENNPPAVRLQAAQSVLDRTGHVKGAEVDVTVKTDGAAFDVLTERLDMLGLAMKPTDDAQIVDGEVVEE